MRNSFFIFIIISVCLSCGTTGKSAKTDARTGCIEGNCTNGTGKYLWPNGISYAGNWVNSSREGYGIYIFPNGDRYEGNFERNVPNGKGKYNYADGTVEEGLFSSFIFVGQILLPTAGDDEKKEVSKVVDVKTTAYEVTVTDAGGLMMGDRLFVEINGIMCALEVIFPMMTVSRCKMIGGTRNLVKEIKKNLPVYKMLKGIKRGKNTFLFPNGNRYVGEYKGNLMHGKGEFFWTNGNKYSGDFKNGVRDGKGILSYSNGTLYTGEFKNGYREGFGKFDWGDGSAYEGTFSKGLKNGKGIYIRSNGDRYTGQYRNDKFEGKGIYVFATGDKYEGEYKDDKFNGKGTYTYSTGRKYVGEFKDGNFHGNGVIYKADGTVENKGRWENDKFVE